MRSESLSIRSAQCSSDRYGCSKDTPSAVLTDVVNALAKKAEVITVAHQCPRGHDIRSLQLSLEQSSYRQIPHPTVLSSFTFSKFADTVFPPSSIDIAIGARELSRLQLPQPFRSGYPTSSQAHVREQLADKEFTSWLNARATEVKSGGLLACMFAIRTCSFPQPPEASPVGPPIKLATSPRTYHDASTISLPAFHGTVSAPPLPSPPMTDGQVRRFRPDIWRAMYHALAPSIQRLVSLGEIRSHVAPLLVDVPFWPRTLENVRSTLSRQQDWEVIREDDEDADDERSAYSPEGCREWSDVGVRIHRLTHPAWTAYCDGGLDRASYARRVATYCRSGWLGYPEDRFILMRDQFMNRTSSKSCGNEGVWMLAIRRLPCRSWYVHG